MSLENDFNDWMSQNHKWVGGVVLALSKRIPSDPGAIIDTLSEAEAYYARLGGS